MRWLTALFSYLTETGDQNILGYKVYGTPSRSFWKHLAILPMPAVEEPEPEKPKTVIGEVVEPEPEPEEEYEPTRMDELQEIEQEYQEDLYIAQTIDDPATQAAAMTQANAKRRKRIARLIGGR